ncbi:hypothetical protein [Nocardiopsis coralliicola]
MEQQLPAAVTTAAVEHGLGEHVAERRGAGKGSRTLTGCGGAVACLVGMGAVASWFDGVDDFSLGHSLLRALVTALLFAALALGVWGLKAPFIATRTVYLHDGGLVSAKGRRIAAHAWDDVDRMEAVLDKGQGSEGKVAGYQVFPRSGEPVLVPLVLTGERDALVDRIAAELRTRGRPIR